jgi:glutathione synthase/RimK-type ligase-like ATP-grasp enzyme
VRRVAIATCAPGGVDPDEPLLVAALAAEGVSARSVAWDADDAFDDDLVVIRSTWDYTWRLGEFLAWARSVARLANPYAAVAYSADKRYLADLADRGVPTVPTTVVAVGDEPTFPPGDVVVKPQVGAGSRDAERHAARDPAAREHVARLQASGRGALIQPYVESVDTAGELCLVFVDGAFSHAVTKAALLGVDPTARTFEDRQRRVSRATADTGALDLASRALAEVSADLLYARVDLLWWAGAWALSELELVEPSLFLAHHAPAAAALAHAIGARLTGPGGPGPTAPG